MQLQQSAAKVLSSGAVSESKEFKIAMNGKAFRLLSDTLYQDKIGSIMREISCNALDSHIMAGTPERPFTIHLPDGFEPWLAIRDYGVGLSPAQIQDVFCTYFESTKDSSNDAVGAFGLGAKTPFAYSDQFNVTSIYNGRKYMYSAFINESDIPEIQLMMEMDTDEENGVEIKVGVDPKDFTAFHTATANQLRFFPVKPIITNYRNGAEFKFLDPMQGDAMYSSPRIQIFEYKGGYTRASINIVQGPVGYPLDIAQILPHLNTDNKRFLEAVSRFGANFYFNIGEIRVTASREGIEYKGMTIDNLQKHIEDSRKEVLDWVTAQMASFKNAYEKAKFLNDNKAITSLVGYDVDVSPAVRSGNNFEFPIDACSKFKCEREFPLSNGSTEKRSVKLFNVARYTKNGMNGFACSRAQYERCSIIPSDDSKVAVVLRDTNKNPVAKMRKFFIDNGLNVLYSINKAYDDAEFDDDFIFELKKSLGGFDGIYRVSEMEDVKRVYTTARGNYTRPTAYRYKGGGDFNSVSDWIREFDALDSLVDYNGNKVEKAIYVTVEKQRIVDSYDVLQKMYNLELANVIKYPIYGIRASDVDKLKKTACEWISATDYVTAEVQKIRNNPVIPRRLAAQHIADLIEDAINRKYLALTGLNKNVPLYKLNRILNRAKEYIHTHQVDRHIINLHGGELDENRKVFKIIEKAVANVFAKAPMMRYIETRSWHTLNDEEEETIRDYLNTCYAA